jgi:hypothetical protein
MHRLRGRVADILAIALAIRLQRQTAKLIGGRIRFLLEIVRAVDVAAE